MYDWTHMHTLVTKQPNPVIYYRIPKINDGLRHIFVVAKMAVQKMAEIEKEDVQPLCATLWQGSFNIR